MKYILLSLAFLINDHVSGMYHKEPDKKPAKNSTLEAKKQQARAFVWDELMAQDQRDAWCKEMYDSNPRRVEAVTIHWSMLLATHLAEIGLIENTDSAIATEAQTLFNNQWELLEKMYTHPSASDLDSK